jgi:hypothetical protein
MIGCSSSEFSAVMSGIERGLSNNQRSTTNSHTAYQSHEVNIRRDCVLSCQEIYDYCVFNSDDRNLSEKLKKCESQRKDCRQNC